MNKYEVLLFDVAGVLVEPSSTVSKTMLGWTNMSNQELWDFWIQSHAVRAFDQGKISSHTFAELVVKELDIPVRPLEYLELFRNWPQRLYEGIPELLSALEGKYRLACFSNTNEAHWPRILEKFNFNDLISERFLSHEMGMIKPDKDAFDFVLQGLGSPAEKIAFFDDNQPNIDAASDIGMNAFLTKGGADLKIVLEELEILENSYLHASVSAD